MSKIAVIGLVGESIFMKMDTLPLPSVTHHASNIHTEAGGKGYNQAVACKKLGVETSYLGRIGNDHYGEVCKSYIESLGVKSIFEIDDKNNTALATILFDETGENTVIVYPGASQYLDIKSVELFKEEIKKADYLIIQYELPLGVIKESIKIAKESDTKVILNPAPAIYDDIELINDAYIITPNFEECKKIFNLPDVSLDELEDILYLICKKLKKIIIVTLGSNGVLVACQNWCKRLDAFKVDTVDTTGAGDVFTAALTVGLVEGKTLIDAVTFATAASALSVTKPYVMGAIPTYDEVIEFLNDVKNKSIKQV